MAGLTDAQKRAKRKYSQNMVHVSFEVNRETESDILDRLNEVPSKQAYIKNLIRKDIGAGN